MEENIQQVQETSREAPKSKAGLIAGVLILAVIGIGSYFIFGANKQSNQSPTDSPAQNSTTSPETSQDPNVKTFTVEGSSFAFSLSSITVNKGDLVKIIFKDTDGRHNLIIDGYGLSTDVIGPGSSDTIEFIADKTGTFEYYCSLPGHKEQGMTGKLIVQ